MHSYFAFSHLQPYYPYEHTKKNLQELGRRGAFLTFRYAYEKKESAKCIFSLLVFILHNVNG
jgi:hypothetical protein